MSGESIKRKFYEQELQKSQRDATLISSSIKYWRRVAVPTEKSDTSSVGSDIRQSSIPGSMPSSPSTDNCWTFCGDKVPKQEVVFISQIIASFIIVIVALLNLSLNDRNKELVCARGSGIRLFGTESDFQTSSSSSSRTTTTPAESWVALLWPCRATARWITVRTTQRHNSRRNWMK